LFIRISIASRRPETVLMDIERRAEKWRKALIDDKGCGISERSEESDPDKGKGGKINQWSHRIAANH